MKEKKMQVSNKIPYYLLILILFVQITVMIVAGIQKKGFFVDEMWSYGLANSFYSPHIWSSDPYITNKYVKPDYFQDYLMVGDEDDFRYDSVFSNLSQDAHPPLYFCVLHTASSVFKYTFSKWFGVIPNILFFSFACVFLFLIGKKITKNAYIALVPVLLWGFTTQTVSYTILIRMYMLLCMFGLMDVWIHGDCLQDNKPWTRKQLIKLFIINYLGCLSQYYYYFFAFFLSALTVFVLMTRKEWRQLFIYSGTMLLAVIAAVISFPRTITIIGESGGWGQQAAAKMTTIHGFREPLKNFGGNLQEKVFYSADSIYPYILICAVIIAVVLWFKRNGKVSVPKLITNINWYCVSIAMASGLFFVLCVKISPFIADRYYYIISPYIWLVGVYTINYVFGDKKVLVYTGCVFLLGISLYTFWYGVKQGKIMYQYPKQAKAEEAISAYYNLPCVYMAGNGREYTAITYMHQLENFPMVLFVNPDRKPMNEYSMRTNAPEMIVYGDAFQNQEQLIKEVKENTGYSQCKLLTRDTGVYWEDTDEQYVYLFY